MRKLFILFLSMIMAVGCAGMAACGDPAAEAVILKVGAVKLGNAWTEIKKDFEKSHEHITLELVVATEPESLIRNQLDVGMAPDILYLPTGRPDGLTEELIDQRAIRNIDDVLNEKVYGEDVTIVEKLDRGMAQTSATNFYQSQLYPDYGTYALPLFHEPSVMLYNEALFNDKGTDGKFKLAKTLDAILNLRRPILSANTDKSAADKQYLFGYTDSTQLHGFLSATIATHAGQLTYERALEYEPIYELSSTGKALKAASDLNNSPEQGGDYGGFVLPASLEAKPQDEVIKAFVEGKVLYMPASLGVIAAIETYVASLASAPANFSLKSMSYPAVSREGQSYVADAIDQIYVLEHTEQMDAAKTFLQYIYSDRAVSIFTAEGKVHATKGGAKAAMDQHKLSVAQKAAYDCIGSARPLNTQFKTAEAEGANWTSAYTAGYHSVLRGADSLAVWTTAKLKMSAEKLRASLLV